ncbi:MAG: ABC transporter permease [Scrofimicrobium sp.]
MTRNKRDSVASDSKLGGFPALVSKLGGQRAVALGALIALFIFFCVAGPGFASANTFVSILDSSYYIGLMAIGMTFVIITGGIDLSVGAVMICAALLAGTLHEKLGLPMWLTLIAAVVVGVIFGLANGFMVAVMKIPAFIATLGTMMVARGLGSIVTATASITYPQRGTPDGWFRNIFKIIEPSGRAIPTGIIVLFGSAILMAYVLNKTKAGRYITALGSNKEATRLSGVDVVKWEMLAYVISGLFAGVAAIAYASIYSTILPGTGNGFELDAIAGTVIGGTSLSGGVGSIAGTMIGVFIMSVLKTGLPFVGLQPHYQIFFTGFVLVIAVFADVVSRQRKKKRKE